MTSKLLILVIAALVAVIFGYDFKDPDFNNYLFEELQSIRSTDKLISTVRNRRETIETTTATEAAEEGEEDSKQETQCCIGDKYNSAQNEVYMAVKKQCYMELNGNIDTAFDSLDCEKMQKIQEQMFCVSECVAKKFNMLDEEGTLKRDVLLAQVGIIAGTSEWKQKASELIVDKCLDEIKEKHAKATEDEVKAKGCNHYPMEFHYCLWRELTNGCPIELRLDTPKCNRIRERLTKGYKPFVQKQFLEFLYERRNDK